MGFPISDEFFISQIESPSPIKTHPKVIATTPEGFRTMMSLYQSNRNDIEIKAFLSGEYLVNVDDETYLKNVIGYNDKKLKV